MSGVLLAMVGYVLVQFAIGIHVSRRMASEADYILAGRSLGTGLVAFSVFASFFGAEAIVSSAGAVYEGGFAGATADPFGYGFALLVTGLLFAAPLWRRGLTTFADLFAERYSPGVEKLVVLMLLPGSLFWAGAQIRAFGQVLSANSALDLHAAITIAAVLVGAYSVVGGLLADSVTDVIQGLAVIAGLIVLTVVVASGSVPPAPMEAVAAVGDAAKGVAVKAGEAAGWGTLKAIEAVLVPVCGTVVSVELISRFLGSRSACVAMAGTSIGAAMYLLVGIMPVYLGLKGAAVLPGLAEPEQIVPKLAEAYLPAGFRIVFVGAIISAILSTVHSALHGPAAQVAHNVVLPVVPAMSARGKLWVVRAAVMVLSVAAYALSLGTERIHDLVEIASAFGSAGVFVVAVFGLYGSFGGAASAYGALAAGMGVWVVARFFLDAPVPYMIALGAALVVYVALGVAMPRRTEAGSSKTA